MSAPNALIVDSNAQAQALQDQLCALPQVDCPVTNYFSKGLYAREMFIPAGTALVGVTHKTQHMVVISQGTIAVMTDNGVKQLSAPCTFVAEPGLKRAGYAMTDVTWTTFHATEETELDKIIEELTDTPPSELMGGLENKQAKMNRLTQTTKLEVVK